MAFQLSPFLKKKQKEVFKASLGFTPQQEEVMNEEELVFEPIVSSGKPAVALKTDNSEQKPAEPTEKAPVSSTNLIATSGATQKRMSNILEQSNFGPGKNTTTPGVKVIKKGAFEDADEDAENEEKVSDDEDDKSEKWVKQASKDKANEYLLPIELPFEGVQEEDQEKNPKDDLIKALKAGQLEILQLPPCAFTGDFLNEKEIDEQELESIEVDFNN